MITDSYRWAPEPVVEVHVVAVGLAAVWASLIEPWRGAAGCRGWAPFSAAGVGQPTDLGDVHVRQLPHVRHEFAVDDETEVEPVEITGEGDVEAVSVGDDRHRELVTQLRPASYSG